MDDTFPLAADFRIEAANLPEGLPSGTPAPGGGERFSGFDQAWRDVFLQTDLSVVLIRNATEEDIEALFARLNNGEPLNAAEKRNALGGDMARLVREVAAGPFFRDRLHFSNGRHQHHELAARMLATEARRPDGELPDLRPAALDAFVRDRRTMPVTEQRRLRDALERGLGRMEDVFGERDQLLSSPSYALLYYLFLERTADEPESGRRRHDFLVRFQREQLAALERPDAEDDDLVEFSGLMQHGGQDRRATARRLEILLVAWRDYRTGTGVLSSSSETA
jgi:hypothetical protein